MLRTLALTMLLSSSAQAIADSGAKVYSAVADSVLFITVEDSSGKEIATGSAFVIDGGLLVTNHHVVAGGTLVRSDPLLDVAILKPEVPVSAKPLSPAQAVPEGPRTVLVPRLLEALEVSKLKYEKVNDGLWGIAYEGKNLPSFMVHVEAADGMVIVWSRVLEKATLSTDVMRALLRASFNANFSKVAIDADGDVIALSELPEDFTAAALERVVAETADLAEQTAGLLGGATTAPKYGAAVPNDPARAGVGARVPILGGAFEITYNPAKWQTSEDDPRVMVHHSGEAWFWAIDERSEITLDGLRDAAIRNAQSSGKDFKLDGESSRKVNDLAVRVIRYSGTASTGLKATFLSQLYSDSNGSVQVVCWTSSNLFPDYEAEFLELFAGFNRVR